MNIQLDLEDVDRVLAAGPWYQHTKGYACRRGGRELLHRFLLGLEAGDRRRVDHANGDKLDNRKVNLRIASSSQNNWNASKRADNTSGVKGVSWYKREQRWVAELSTNGTRQRLGYFTDKADAERAVRTARERKHGGFARHD